MIEALISSKTRVKMLLKFFLNANSSGYLRGLEQEFGDRYKIPAQGFFLRRCSDPSRGAGASGETCHGPNSGHLLIVHWRPQWRQ